MDYTQRFRRQVAAYNVLASLRAVSDSAHCPPMQTIKADGQPTIDRSSVPTVLAATINASSQDSSGGITSAADSSIVNVKWYVQRGDEAQGTEITLHSDWLPTEYSIGTNADKGKLTIRKNVPAGTTWKIWMECDISDNRRGYAVVVPVVTDSEMLFSVADGAATYGISIDRPNGEVYEPMLDRRLLHVYKVGNGEADTLMDDDSSYLRTINVLLKRGKDTLVPATDYTVKVYRVTALNQVEITPATDNALESLTDNVAVFNMLFDSSASFVIKCFVGSGEVASVPYGWMWSNDYPTTDEGIVGADTYCGSKRTSYRVKLNYAGSLLEHPSVAFDLAWYFRGQSYDIYVGRGESMTYDLTDSRMFPSGSTDVEVKLSMSKRGVFRHIADGSNMLTDENGNYYIEN